LGINGVDVEDCMTNPYSVDEFSAMMKVAQRPFTLNINHIKKAAAKPRAPPASPAPKQKTSNPMIPVFIMFAILCAVIIGIWHDDHPIVAGNAAELGQSLPPGLQSPELGGASDALRATQAALEAEEKANAAEKARQQAKVALAIEQAQAAKKLADAAEKRYEQAASEKKKMAADSPK
jgi:hypothetical protein